MKKIISKSRIAILLAFIMFFGTFSGMPVQASETVTVDMTNAIFNFDTLLEKPNNKITIGTASVTNLPDNIEQIYNKSGGRLQPANTESGWFIDGKRVEVANNGMHHYSDCWYFCIEEPVQEGQIVTVTGTFTKTANNVTYNLIMPTLQFKRTADSWIHLVTVDMTDAIFNFDTLLEKPNNKITIGTASVTNLPDNVEQIYNKSGGRLQPANTESGWFIDGKRVEVTNNGMHHFSNCWYFCIEESVQEGQIVTVTGTFTKTVNNTTYNLVMPTLQFKRTADSWIHLVTVDMTQSGFNFSGVLLQETPERRFIIEKGKITNPPENYSDAVKAGFLQPADDESGWFVGEERLEVDSNTGIRLLPEYVYFDVGPEAAQRASLDTVFIIKGTFTTTKDGVMYNITMPTIQLKCVYGRWVAADAEIISVDMTNASFRLDNLTNNTAVAATRFTITSTRIEGAPDMKFSGKGLLTPVDSESGWYLGDTKVDTACGVQLLADGTWIFHVGTFDDKTVLQNTVIKVKGTFSNEREGKVYVVNMPELQFEYVDGVWLYYAEDGDYNADQKISIVDLVRLKRYIASPDTIKVPRRAFFNDESNQPTETNMLYNILLKKN